MTNLISRVLTGLAATALPITTIVALATPARAFVDTYTPQGGPTAAVIDHDIAFTIDEPGYTFTCEQFNLYGPLTNPGLSRPFGTTAVTWDQFVFNGCINPISGSTTFEPTGNWGFAVTGPEVGSVSPATFTNLGALFGSAGCEFNVAGEVRGTFDDATGVFTPTGSTLTIADSPVGPICPIFGFAQGQSISVSGAWRITGLTIANP